MAGINQMKNHGPAQLSPTAFECNVCGKSFAWKSIPKAHVKWVVHLDQTSRHNCGKESSAFRLKPSLLAVETSSLEQLEPRKNLHSLQKNERTLGTNWKENITCDILNGQSKNVTLPMERRNATGRHFYEKEKSGSWQMTVNLQNQNCLI